jgi:uncharacterized protein Yka (UPF0111/DUF47 family)
LPRLPASAIVTLLCRDSSGERHPCRDSCSACCLAKRIFSSCSTSKPITFNWARRLCSTKLNQSFITPFDREDIHELTSQLDDVIDLIDAAASRFVLYRVASVRQGTVDLVKVLVSATVEVSAAVRALSTPEKALKHCIEINRYENESDRLCRTLIAQLFDEETDSVQIIKWKEIFEVIETAVDKCEDVANVIEGVILKNA